VRTSITAALLLSALLPLGGCCLTNLFRSEPPPLLSELDWSTPAASVETFRRAFQADAADYEFLCLSEKLTEKHGIGIFEYGLGRERFIDQNRALVDLFLRAECDPPRRVPGTDPPQVVIRLRHGDHFADFLLVNEPVLWVKFDDEGTMEVLEVPLESLGGVIELRGERLHVLALPTLPYEIESPDDIVKITLTQRWRLLDIVGWSSSLDQALSQSEPEPSQPEE
jgi:hypothetical protein